MADKSEKEKIWLEFAHDATRRYVMPDAIEDSEDLVDDMAEIATGYADAMLEEFEERFSGGARRTRKKAKKSEEAEEEDDPDLDDDDD